MKRLIISLLFVWNYPGVRAQNENLVLDTIHFADAKFYEGQEIILGSSDDSIFNYIMTGKNMDSLRSLPASYARQTLKVSLVYKNDFGFVIVASASEESKLPGFVFIRVKEALVSREMQIPVNSNSSFASLNEVLDTGEQ